MNQTLRRILELVGMVESQQAVLRRKLLQQSQQKPQGKASLIVRKVGTKENSAASMIRSLTGLDMAEVSALLNHLPHPLLIHVSAETAVAAQRSLARLGVETEIIGLSVNPEDVVLPEKTPAKEGQQRRQKRPFPIQAGNYTVTLTTVGLLGERVLDGVQRITGRAVPDLAVLEEKLPLVLLEGVDEETAVKAQTLLQMVGAVVNIDEQAGEAPE